VSLKTMPNGFVQEDARPTWPKHHFHRAGGCFHRTELQNRLTRTLTRNRLGVKLAREYVEATPAASALITGLPFAVFFGNTQHIQPHQWLQIPCSLAFGSDNQNVFGLVHVDRLHLLDPPIKSTSSSIRFFQKRDFLCNLDLCGKDGNRVAIPFPL